MFRHVALFRWNDEATTIHRQAIADGLGQLPSHIPELRGYSFGSDEALVDGNWDFAVVADFDDVDGWRRYTDHPEHQRVLAELIRPALAERAAVQYEF